MAKRVHARRYAQAVFEIAQETKQLDKWQEDLSKLRALTQDAGVVAVLENPKLRFDAKAGLIKQAMADISPVALNLVYLLMLRGRLSMVNEIAHEYHLLLDASRGIEHAEATTAVPMDDGEKKGLEQRLAGVIGKKIVLETRIDPALIGGVVVRAGGRMLDGSTRSKLLALKKDLAGTEK